MGLHLERGNDVWKLLKDARLVITGTGNIGIEAALRGIPVIYFGNPWWTGMPGRYSYKELRETSAEAGSLSGVHKKVVTDFLLERCLSEMLPGGASETETALRRRFPEIAEGFGENSANEIARFLAHYLESQLS